jgi:hypothetical protein
MSVSDIAFWAVMLVFVVKLSWNAAVPYWLAWRKWSSGTEAGTSLMSYIEVSAFVVGVVLVMLGAAPGLSPLGAFAGGGLLLVVSYLHLVLMTGFLSWLVTRLRRESQTGP